MTKVVEFIKESYTEMIHKVTWPTWIELQNSGALVLVASVIIAIIVLAMDQASSNVMHLFYQSLAK
jgi:preprotein translocase subunit SecE